MQVGDTRGKIHTLCKTSHQFVEFASLGCSTRNKGRAVTPSRLGEQRFRWKGGVEIIEIDNKCSFSYM